MIRRKHDNSIVSYCDKCMRLLDTKTDSFVSALVIIQCEGWEYQRGNICYCPECAPPPENTPIENTDSLLDDGLEESIGIECGSTHLRDD